MNIAVLASGSGSNFEALVNAQKEGLFNAQIVVLITDKKTAYVRERAKNLGIKDILVDKNSYANREDFDKATIDILIEHSIDLVVLAGYMLLLSPYFVGQYKNRIINIHPAFLPKFPGTHAIADAYNSGAKETGVTVHYVDEGIDTGPIILQQSLAINKDESLELLEQRIHTLEHKIYPKAIKQIEAPSSIS